MAFPQVTFPGAPSSCSSRNPPGYGQSPPLIRFEAGDRPKLHIGKGVFSRQLPDREIRARAKGDNTDQSRELRPTNRKKLQLPHPIFVVQLSRRGHSQGSLTATGTYRSSLILQLLLPIIVQLSVGPQSWSGGIGSTASRQAIASNSGPPRRLQGAVSHHENALLLPTISQSDFA
jgi:hypothetical protein